MNLINDRFELDSIFKAGTENEMYMRTPPHSSGAGVSGYWNNMLFRSLMELQVAWTLINEEGLLIEANETRDSSVPKIRIPVKLKGLTRYYVPDFIHRAGKELIEVKAYGNYFIRDILPQIEPEVNKAGWVIRVIDKKEVRQDPKLIKMLWDNGELEIHPNKMERFKKYMLKNFPYMKFD